MNEELVKENFKIEALDSLNSLDFRQVELKATGNYKEDFEALNRKKILEQFYNFRHSIKNNLVRLLYFEITLLSAILILQGFGYKGFKLNDWAFGFFVNGCLIQTFFLIRYIVKHLFPESDLQVFLRSNLSEQPPNS